MLDEFKKFAMRGNVIDMAVGVVIGVAFGAIVKSLVADVLMPPLGLALGGVDFAEAFVVLKQGAAPAPYATVAAAREAGAVTLNYGLFLNAVISFLIIALALFVMVRALNRLQRQEAPPPAPPTTKDCTFCFTSIPLKATRCPRCTSELAPR